jgi:hypothetical protein
MSDQQTMYRAFFGFQGLSMWHPHSPVPHFHSEMTLSPWRPWPPGCERLESG